MIYAPNRFDGKPVSTKAGLDPNRFRIISNRFQWSMLQTGFVENRFQPKPVLTQTGSLLFQTGSNDLCSKPVWWKTGFNRNRFGPKPVSHYFKPVPIIYAPNRFGGKPVSTKTGLDSSRFRINRHYSQTGLKSIFWTKYKKGHSSSHRASQKLSMARFGSKLRGESFLDNCGYARTYTDTHKNYTDIHKKLHGYTQKYANRHM